MTFHLQVCAKATELDNGIKIVGRSVNNIDAISVIPYLKVTIGKSVCVKVKIPHV